MKFLKLQYQLYVNKKYGEEIWGVKKNMGKKFSHQDGLLKAMFWNVLEIKNVEGNVLK